MAHQTVTTNIHYYNTPSGELAIAEQCNWDRRQSLLVDPIPASTTVNATGWKVRCLETPEHSAPDTWSASALHSGLWSRRTVKRRPHRTMIGIHRRHQMWIGVPDRAVLAHPEKLHLDDVCWDAERIPSTKFPPNGGYTFHT